VRVVVTFTRSGPRRRVDRELLQAAGPAAHAFVCGSTAFVEATAALLMGLGHDPAVVRTERFGGAV
jgi:ferredoxin-NADP reductase